jgi:hypothetical protein
MFTRPAAILFIGLWCTGAASAAPLTVGYLTGPAGSDAAFLAELTQSLADDAEADLLGLTVVTTDTLDAAFYGGIDVFLHRTARGGTALFTSAAQRADMVSFVQNGGTMYVGVDGAFQDQLDLVAAFGFSLIDYQNISSTGVITDLGHPIATGPFQPASQFPLSVHGRFDDAVVPAGGSFLGATPLGQALAYRTLGTGQVYIFADATPINVGFDNPALFKNVLVDLGAVAAPEPGTGVVVSVGIAWLGMHRRRRAGSMSI